MTSSLSCQRYLSRELNSYGDEREWESCQPSVATTCATPPSIWANEIVDRTLLKARLIREIYLGATMSREGLCVIAMARCAQEGYGPCVCVCNFGATQCERTSEQIRHWLSGSVCACKFACTCIYIPPLGWCSSIQSPIKSSSRFGLSLAYYYHHKSIELGACC